MKTFTSLSWSKAGFNILYIEYLYTSGKGKKGGKQEEDAYLFDLILTEDFTPDT